MMLKLLAIQLLLIQRLYGLPVDPGFFYFGRNDIKEVNIISIEKLFITNDEHQGLTNWEFLNPEDESFLRKRENDLPRNENFLEKIKNKIDDATLKVMSKMPSDVGVGQRSKRQLDFSDNNVIMGTFQAYTRPMKLPSLMDGSKASPQTEETGE